MYVQGDEILKSISLFKILAVCFSIFILFLTGISNAACVDSCIERCLDNFKVAAQKTGNEAFLNAYGELDTANFNAMRNSVCQEECQKVCEQNSRENVSGSVPARNSLGDAVLHAPSDYVGAFIEYVGFGIFRFLFKTSIGIIIITSVVLLISGVITIFAIYVIKSEDGSLGIYLTAVCGLIISCSSIFIIYSKIASFFIHSTQNVSSDFIEKQISTELEANNNDEQRILGKIQSLSDSDITGITYKKDLYQKLVLLQPNNSQYASMLKVYTHRLVTKHGEMLAEYGPDYAKRLNLPTTQIETSADNHSRLKEEPTTRTSKGYLSNAYGLSKGQLQTLISAASISYSENVDRPGLANSSRKEYTQFDDCTMYVSTDYRQWSPYFDETVKQIYRVDIAYLDMAKARIVDLGDEFSFVIPTLNNVKAVYFYAIEKDGRKSRVENYESTISLPIKNDFNRRNVEDLAVIIELLINKCR